MTSLYSFLSAELVPPSIQASDRVLESITDLRDIRTNIGSTVRMLESSSLTLICQASGVPRPIITWQLNGKLLERSDDVIINEDALVLNKTKKEQTGIITCTAKNVGGNISVASQLTVVGT